MLFCPIQMHTDADVAMCACLGPGVLLAPIFPSLIGAEYMSHICAGSLQPWALTVHLPVPHSRTWRACIVHTVQEAKRVVISVYS